MPTQELLVKPTARLKATRTPIRSKPRPTAPRPWWGLDMTMVLGEPVGGGSVDLGLDGDPKQLVGHTAGLHAKRAHGRLALEQAGLGQCPEGVHEQGRSLRSDKGCQPTSVAFLRTCAPLGITQAVTSSHNPKGNADTVRLRRTLQAERLWLRDWTHPGGRNGRSLPGSSGTTRDMCMRRSGIGHRARVSTDIDDSTPPRPPFLRFQFPLHREGRFKADRAAVCPALHRLSVPSS
jgi:transposase InsO family protein